MPLAVSASVTFSRPTQNVVVAQNGIAQRAFELVEEVGALPCGADGKFVWRRPVRDEVAGEKHHIGIQAVDAVDGIADKERLSEFVDDGCR